MILHLPSGGISHALAHLSRTVGLAEELQEEWTVLPFSYSAVGRHLFKDVLQIFHPLYVEPSSAAGAEQLAVAGLGNVQSFSIVRDETRNGKYLMRASLGETDELLEWHQISSIQELLRQERKVPRITAGAVEAGTADSVPASHWSNFVRASEPTISYLNERKNCLPPNIALAAHFRGNDRVHNLDGFITSLKQAAGTSQFGETVFWCSDVADSAERARPLLEPRFQIRVETTVPLLSGGESNIHARSSEWYAKRGIDEVRLVRDALFDLWILTAAQKTVFSSDASGWSGFVDGLKKHEKRRSALFGVPFT